MHDVNCSGRPVDKKKNLYYLFAIRPRLFNLIKDIYGQIFCNNTVVLDHYQMFAKYCKENNIISTHITYGSLIYKNYYVTLIIYRCFW